MRYRDRMKAKRAIERSQKMEAKNETDESFGPFKQRVKERFYRRLKEQHHIFDKETAFSSPQIMEQLAGTDRIHEWMTDPVFAQWMMDEHIIADELMALRNKAVNRLRDILYKNDSLDSDALKAARLIFEVTDQFPSKKQEVRFLDQELDKMPDRQVDIEIKKLQTKLGEEE